MKKLLILIGIVTLTNIAVYAQTDIHNVDFKNFTYQPSCTDMEDSKKLENITVKDGKFVREKQEKDYVDRFYFDALEVTYGDMTGDGKDEAIILSNCNTGGTGQFTEGFIYTMKSGKPTLLARVPGGDRADGGLKSLKAVNGQLVVVAYDPSANSGACCPEFTMTSTYSINGGNLTEIGKGVRRELYPKERISFAKGASEKTFSVKIPPEDRKRYTVGARAGQTLSVSISGGGNVYLSLLGDTANEGTTDRFTAKLPKNGDYTFEIGNDGDKDDEVTVTVKIM